MKKNLLILFALLTISLALSGCSGRRVTTSGWPGLSVDGDTAYLASGPHVYAVNLKNGTLQWQFPAEQQRDMNFYAPPAVLDENQLIVGGYDNTLYSVNPANGKENWSYTEPRDRIIAAPLIRDEAIYFTSADHRLYAVDHQGDQLWAPFETEEPIWSSPVWSEECQCVFISSMDHRVYAVDPDEGTEIWRTEDLGGPIVSRPVLSEDGVLYVSTFANEILAVDVANRQVEWRFTTSDWAWASPAIAEEQIYASDLSGNFYALDRETGRENWSINPGGRIVTEPLILEDLIFFGTDEGSLVVTSKDGTIQRNQQISGKIYSSPEQAEDLILVAPTEHDQLLMAFNQDGTKVWNFTPGQE